jgi:hypothetical protein
VRFLVLALPTELTGGRYPAPAWAILALGGLVVAGAAVYLGVRWRRLSGPKPGSRDGRDGRDER